MEDNFDKSICEEIEKKLMDDATFSPEEKLIIIRALEKAMVSEEKTENEDVTKTKKLDYYWYDHNKENSPPSFPNWDYTKGPTC